MKILLYGFCGLLGKEFIKVNQDLINLDLGDEIIAGMADITDILSVEDDIKRFKPDIIINFAGVIDYKGRSAHIFINNLVGPLNILDCSNGIPVITIGSISSIELNKNMYALSKHCLELVTKQYKNLYVVRLPGIFSPNRRTGAIYNFYKKCLKNEEIVIDCDLKVWNCLYFTTAIDTILANLKEIITGDQIKNIGYGDWHSLSEVAILFKIQLKSSSNIIINMNPKKFNMVECDGTFIQAFSNLREDIMRYVNLCDR